MIAIIANLGGEVEGHREASYALGEEEVVAAVAFFGGGETGVLAHGPELVSVHGRVYAAGEGSLAGKLRHSGGFCVERFYFYTGIGFHSVVGMLNGWIAGLLNNKLQFQR